MSGSKTKADNRRKALVLAAVAKLLPSQKQTFNQTTANVLCTMPDLLSVNHHRDGTAKFCFKPGGGSVSLTMGEIMGEPTLTSKAVEVGDCDGCDVPMIDDTGAGMPGTEPPPGMVFLGMQYTVRGAVRAKLCEDCYAKSVVWAAREALKKRKVSD